MCTSAHNLCVEDNNRVCIRTTHQEDPQGPRAAVSWVARCALNLKMLQGLGIDQDCDKAGYDDWGDAAHKFLYMHTTCLCKESARTDPQVERAAITSDSPPEGN